MSEVKIRPLNDRVIVKRVVEHTTAAGIVIPETAGDKPQRGKVSAVGPGKLDSNGTWRPVDLKVGDEVLFGKYSGTEIKVDGQDLLIMREEDILGVVQH